jgi:hypothetical protein
MHRYVCEGKVMRPHTCFHRPTAQYATAQPHIQGYAPTHLFSSSDGPLQLTTYTPQPFPTNVSTGSTYSKFKFQRCWPCASTKTWGGRIDDLEATSTCCDFWRFMVTSSCYQGVQFLNATYQEIYILGQQDRRRRARYVWKASKMDRDRIMFILALRVTHPGSSWTYR